MDALTKAFCDLAGLDQGLGLCEDPGMEAEVQTNRRHCIDETGAPQLIERRGGKEDRVLPQRAVKRGARRNLIGPEPLGFPPVGL